MPIGEYFKGAGESVMEDMQKRYGKKKGKSVFYATANKRDAGPESPDLKVVRKKLAAKAAKED